MSSDTRIRSRLRKQIRWLCDQLAKRTHGFADCPPNVQQSEACYKGDVNCAECWREAGRWAAKEDADGAE